MTKVSIAAFSKQELVWMAGNYCKHKHTYLEHPACYVKERGVEEKIGFLDIEASNLDASFGVMICWCIKEIDKNLILSDIITIKDIKDHKKEEDKRITLSLIRSLQKFDRIVTHYGCVIPGHRVLTADLRWVLVETVKQGDKLFAFEEEPRANCRRWVKEATVIHNIPTKQEVFRIELSDGAKLEATGNHPWLVKRGNQWCWKTTEELIHFNGNNEMQRIMPLWSSKNVADEGYAAAFLDGEGHLNQAPKREFEYSFGISFSQKDPYIIKHFTSCLDRLGFKYSLRQYDANHPYMVAINILGGRHETLRFLGQLQPAKLKNLNIDRLGGIQLYKTIPIKQIINVGVKTVMGLGTTTQTYIVEGFGSHNSRFDIPFIRTRAIINRLDFPRYGELVHEDNWYIARHKLKMHSNRLAVLEETLVGRARKTRLKPKIWRNAMRGHKQSLDYILTHCKKDVRSLEDVWKKIEMFKKHTKASA